MHRWLGCHSIKFPSDPKASNVGYFNRYRKAKIWRAIFGVTFLISCKVTQYDYALVSNIDTNLDLYVSISNSQLQNITNDKNVDYGIKWSPDGNLILFAKKVNKQYDLNLYNIALKTTEQLTDESLVQTGTSLSPDGEKILFTSNVDHKFAEIYLMNLSTRKITRTTSNDKLDGSAIFHPYGNCIFYSLFMDKDSVGGITNSEIFVTDTIGSYHTRLTNRKGNDGALDISPDGEKIACYYFLNGKADIYVMNIKGGNMKQLTSDTLDNRWPRWSPDKKCIAYTRVANNNSDIWIMGKTGANKNKTLFQQNVKRFLNLDRRKIEKPAQTRKR